VQRRAIERRIPPFPGGFFRSAHGPPSFPLGKVLPEPAGLFLFHAPAAGDGFDVLVMAFLIVFFLPLPFLIFLDGLRSGFSDFFPFFCLGHRSVRAVTLF